MDPLLAQYRETGSQEAFREIVNRYTAAVYSQCLRQTRSREMAEDVTQAVFVLLARKAAGLKPGVVLEGWLFNTARYGCLNALRMQRRRKHYEQVAAATCPEAVSSGPAGELEMTQVLDTALAKLSKADREAIVLRYYGQKSVADVAGALGISVDAAKQRISRAVGRMRQICEQQGVTAPAVVLLPDILERLFAEPAPAHLASQAAEVALGSAAAPSGVSAVLVAVGKGQMKAKVLPILAAALIAFAVVNTGWFLWPKARLPLPPMPPREQRLMSQGAKPGWGMVEGASPRDVLTRLAKAIAADDAAEVSRQIMAKGPEEMNVGNAVLQLGMARDALKALWEQKYGDAQKWPKLQWLTFGEILGKLTMVPDGMVLHQMWPDEVMVYVNAKPEQLFGPVGMTPMGQRWAQGSLVCRRDGEQWKLDLDATMVVSVMAVPAVPADQAATLRRQVASINACTRVLREVAEQIRTGRLGSSSEAMAFLLDHTEQAMKQLGTPGMEFAMQPRW